MSKRTRTIRKQLPKAKTASPVADVTRHIPPLLRLKLFVASGGRCQFDSCNRYLLEHHVTLCEGNFSEVAHVVAFSADGPRGSDPRPADINEVGNLMTMCPGCHKLVDDNPEKFTKEILLGYKKAHETRIRHVTGLGPDQKTTVLCVKSRIGQQTVSLPFDHILEATTPRYPSLKDPFIIDLTQISAESTTFVKTACETIREDLRGFFGPSSDFKKTGHVSLFALSTIPVLMFLGTQLSNKVPLEILQRHRDTERWTWKSTGTAAEYDFTKVRNGTDSNHVALLLSLSGKITTQNLPASIDTSHHVYELTLENIAPTPTFLNRREDLENFRTAYQSTLAELLKEHPNLTTIELFPAVPAPVAVLCGRELLPKVHPQLRVYDNDKRAGGFVYQLTIN